MAYYVNRVKFEDLHIVMSIYKQQGRSKEEVLSFFSHAKNQQIVTKQYDTVAPIQVKQALKLANVEQRMVVLRGFAPEIIAQQLDATLLDSQSIKKTQTRWDKDLKPYTHTYTDTYALYKIASETLGLDGFWHWREPAIYFVKCECPSTDRLYYLYVPHEAAQNNDAIEAIAWTMRFNDQPLTKDQYLHLMYSET
ncbi:hypothetical protein [uncultured Microscilla sp.]|uniref:hypothetical protein n=1 Tax=uncultured Microscilla sp. TaxID=432653 RepID=UPI00261FD4F5|nr:hypothetical protein [uncultured Microscilla sp.]